MELQAASSASGIVSTRDGKPIVNGRVILNVAQPSGETAARLDLLKSTDDNGTYFFRGLLPGSSCRVDVYRADQHKSSPVFEGTGFEANKLDDVVVNDPVDGTE